MEQRTFYEYLMSERNPKSYDEVAELADHVFFDHAFPKQSTDFDEISKYLEENGNYVTSMTVFDEAWHRYLDYRD